MHAQQLEHVTEGQLTVSATACRSTSQQGDEQGGPGALDRPQPGLLSCRTGLQAPRYEHSLAVRDTCLDMSAVGPYMYLHAEKAAMCVA